MIKELIICFTVGDSGVEIALDLVDVDSNDIDATFNCLRPGEEFHGNEYFGMLDEQIIVSEVLVTVKQVV